MPESVEVSIIAIDAASNILGKIGDQFGALGEIAVTALTAAGSAMDYLIKAGAEQEDEQARFNALVDSSPLKDYKQTMEDMAAAYSKTTRFQEDNIKAAEGQLSLYTNISQKVFPDVLKATLDYATFTKTDATSAAQALGRAFEDISGGSLTMIARSRLITKEQKETAEAMAKTGDDAGAQAYIIGILNGKIGGLAETMGNTAAGKWEIFNNKIKEMGETLGAKLLPALEPVIDKLSELADEVAPVLADLFTNYLVPAFGGLIDFIGRLASAFMVMQGSGDQISNFVAGLSNMMYSLDNINPLFDKLGDALAFFSLWWETYGPSIMASAMQMWDAIVQGAQQVWNIIEPLISEILGKLVIWFAENGPLITKYVQTIADVFSNYLVPAVVFAIDVISPLISGLVDLMLGVAKLFMQIITGDWKGAWETAKQIVSDAVDAIGKSLDKIVKLFKPVNDMLMKMTGYTGASDANVNALFLHPLQSSFGKGIGSRAGGGGASGLTWVGEQGPELVSLPAGSYVHNNRDSMGMMGGSTIVFNISTPALIGSGQAARDALLPVLRDATRQLQAEGLIPQ